jgi:predicted TIM-barrel fold metal-dependent hydrolase
VIDTDVHAVDFFPGLSEYIDRFAGPAAVDTFRKSLGYLVRSPGGTWYDLSPEQRRNFRAVRPPWWGSPAENTLDLATAALPELLYQRLEDLGVDFGVVFPNLSLGAIFFSGEGELRLNLAKAVNAYNADLYRPYGDRLTPVAVIPLHTPQEGVEALEHAAGLGFKAALIPGSVRRPIKGYADKVKDHPDAARALTWLDFFGLDSEYDYDPFWARAVELGIPLTTHSGSQGWEARSSISNYQFNHIGHFAQASDALAKSLFFGGVTRRFPKLRVGLLEGGAAWGAQLWNDTNPHNV